MTGPVTDDDVRDALRDGKLEGGAQLRLAGSDLWASPRAFVALARSPGAGTPSLPVSPTSVVCALPGELAAAPQNVRDVLLFWVAEGDLVFGPLSGEQLRLGVEAGKHREAAASLVDDGVWVRAVLLAAPCEASGVEAAELAREPSLPGPPVGTPRPARTPQRAIYLGAAAPPEPSKSTLSAERPSGPRLTPVKDATPSSTAVPVRCPTCLERIPPSLVTCPECGEPVVTAPPSTSGSPSIPDDLPGQSALAMHWRPIVTLGVITTLVCTGIALRHLAPGRFLTPARTTARAAPLPSPAAAACATACWNGEACQGGHCVWHAPNDVGHVAAVTMGDPQRVPQTPPVSTTTLGDPQRVPQPPPVSTTTLGDPQRVSAVTMGEHPQVAAADAGAVALPAPEPMIAGPFALPRDVTDALPLDRERFAVALLTGLEIHNARTGGVLGLVTDAPQSRRLYRVGQVIYATAPQRIFVVDADTTRLLKTIEIGATVGEVTVGASGRRALASLPGAHAIAVIATEYHAEIDRIQFGDDAVGPMGADDTGKRALTTTGQVPLPGLAQPQGGAVYAFDPSRLASEQDRVRASMVGNPVSVLMTPDGERSYVVLRAEDALVPLEWLPSGAVRQEARIPTCREPEQIELVRRGRLGVVRCNEGRAIEVFDLQKRELLRHVPFNARVADLAIAPDGKQAIVALPAEGVSHVGGDPQSLGPAGFVGIVDLETWAVKVLPLTAEPTRVRLSPDGAVALVLSDRAKVAWVIR